jgi:Gly-Xaa carboxypeptidase
VKEVQARISSILTPISQSLNISIDAFGNIINGPARGKVVLSDAFGTALDPSPKTPTFGSAPWELLSGTIISVLQSSIRTGYEPDGVPVFVAPALSLGTFSRSPLDVCADGVVTYRQHGHEDVLEPHQAYIQVRA